jgi:hypothetical protein
MDISDREKLMAAAIYEIRLLLSNYVGSSCDADPDVRLAAHLAYALHNEALIVFEGDGEFDIDAARKNVAHVEKFVGAQFSNNGKHLMG